MAKNDTFHCSLITPERVLLRTDATFAAFPAHDGEVGILPGRAPLLYKMGIGELRVESPQGNHRFFVDGGFAQMVENRLSFLTQIARPVAELDRAEAQRALAEARAMPMLSDAEFDARQRALRSAETRLRLAPSPPR